MVVSPSINVPNSTDKIKEPSMATINPNTTTNNPTSGHTMRNEFALFQSQLFSHSNGGLYFNGVKATDLDVVPQAVKAWVQLHAQISNAQERNQHAYATRLIEDTQVIQNTILNMNLQDAFNAGLRTILRG